jgi:hypothetical protein
VTHHHTPSPTQSHFCRHIPCAHPTPLRCEDPRAKESGESEAAAARREDPVGAREGREGAGRHSDRCSERKREIRDPRFDLCLSLSVSLLVDITVGTFQDRVRDSDLRLSQKMKTMQACLSLPSFASSRFQLLSPCSCSSSSSSSQVERQKREAEECTFKPQLASRPASAGGLSASLLTL